MPLGDCDWRAMARRNKSGAISTYLKAIAPILEKLARAQRDLDDVKRLAGSEALKIWSC